MKAELKLINDQEIKEIRNIQKITSNIYNVSFHRFSNVKIQGSYCAELVKYIKTQNFTIYISDNGFITFTYSIDSITFEITMH